MFSALRHRVLAAAGVAVALALTATACEPGHGGAGGVSRPPGRTGDSLADRLSRLGIDVDHWRDGGWRDWDRWSGAAEDFVNPVIAGLWQPDRMRSADAAGKTVPARDALAHRQLSDPPPPLAEAVPERTPYREYAAPMGKLFFDSPGGSLVCSGTVVRDVYHPGKSNLVWTAGHCVHAGRSGGWYRNIAFVPAFNDLGRSEAGLADATEREVAPYGLWWADRAATSEQWIRNGSETGGAGAAYDYAVLRVRPESGGRSLEETVGTALPVDFSAPPVSEVGPVSVWGYPAAPPYDGLTMFRCVDRPRRLSLGPELPTMYRVGCPLTGGASGGGWFRRVGDRLELVSNTSIGPVDGAWLAGPRLGGDAKRVYDTMGARYGGR
nr:trypsin-like peptidase domain-containing protein [Streptomyces ruber]